MALDGYFKFVLALVFVLGLIVLLSYALRRFGMGGLMVGARQRGGSRRLAVVEVAAIDAKRRLILIRRDQTEHLVLLGAQSETVIESGIPASPEIETPQRDDKP